jgi:hypothetical protein
MKKLREKFLVVSGSSEENRKDPFKVPGSGRPAPPSSVGPSPRFNLNKEKEVGIRVRLSYCAIGVATSRSDQQTP